MQAMMKKLLLLLSVLVIAGCATSGYGNIWSTPDYSTPPAPAAAAPRPLYGAPQTQAMNDPAMSNPAMNPAMSGMAPPPVYTPPGTYPPATPDNGFNAAMQPGYAAPDAGVVPPQVQPVSTSAMPPVKVALLVPLSGKQADLGQAMLQAAQLALFDMGYNTFELMPRDTKGSAEGAREAAQSAINDGAQMILGPLFAYEVRAAQDVTSRYNINMIAFSTDWTLAGGNTYIMGFLPFDQVQRIVDYAGAHGMRRIGVLAPDNDYGNAVVSAFNNAAYRTGVTPTDIMKFPPNGGDMSAIVRQFSHYDERSGGAQPGQAASTGPAPYDAVLLPVGGEQARAIGNLLSYYDLDSPQVKRLGTGLWDDEALATEPALAGAWFAAPSPEARRGFETRYGQLYGHRPPRLSTLAYDATALAAVLARNGYQTMGHPAFDRASLTNPNGFAGLDGVFRFRGDGLVDRGMAVLEFRETAIKTLDPAPATFQRY